MNAATAQQSSTTDWLSRALAAGAVESANVKALAEQAGIGTKALRNARERLGVVATRHGNGVAMRSTWSLPATAALASEVGSSARAEAICALEPLLRSAKVLAQAVGDPGSPKAPGHGLLKFVKVESAQPALTPAEHTRVDLRARDFVRRGMSDAPARHLAIKLVIERDRPSRKEGACIECQCFDGGSCLPGSQGHTPGPRDQAEIWMCWCARRE